MGGPTPCQPIRLTDQHTLHDTITILRRHLPLTAAGYRCHTEDLWRLLVGAAARHTTLEAVCADLLDAPHANTVRGYLTAQVAPQAIPALEQQWNTAFAALIPEWLRARPQDVAVDFHDEPDYGRCDPDDPDNWVCRGEAQAGTTYFYRCATAYVMHRDACYTLAVVFVKPREDKVAVLDRLLTHVRQLGVRLRCLYADEGFCAIPVGAALAGDAAHLGHHRGAHPREAGRNPCLVPGPQQLSHDASLPACRAWRGDRARECGAYLPSPAVGAAAGSLVGLRLSGRRRAAAAGAQALPAPLRHREQLPADGTGAGTDHLAQCGPALLADGPGAVDRECVARLALALPPAAGARSPARGTLALSPGSDGTLPDAGD